MTIRHFTIHAIFGFALLALAACSPSHPNDFAQANWITNAEQAMTAAKQQGKPLLIAFMGSDWSVASQAAQKEVLDTVAFKDYADSNLVLLKIDFTRKGLSPELQKAYAEMAKGLQVDRIPVYFLADPAHGVGPFQRLNSMGNSGPQELINQIAATLAEYRNQLAAQMALPQGQPPGTPMAQPGTPRPAGVSGFPSPDELLRKPAAPAPNPAAASGTAPLQVQLK